MSFRPGEREIQAFWTWFATIADELGDDLTNGALHDDLDARLRCLGDVAWELGPGATAENALAISPDGSPDLLPATRCIVALAPKLSRWEFHPARPARAASLEFSIETRGGGEVTVDARPWRYVLFELPDHTFDIVIEQANLVDAREEDRHVAAVVLLDALLGEADRLLRIRDVEPAVALSPEQEAKASPITVLRAHLDARISGSRGG